jgi:hypothetical protein
MSRLLTAEYYSHETREIEEITQDFDGTNEYIAREYFEIYGDTLVSLTEDGEKIYAPEINWKETLKYG